MIKTSYLLLIVIFFSCKIAKNTNKENVFYENYKVITLNGMNTLLTSPTLKFDFKKNKISGFTGCNNYNADFIKEGNTIQFKNAMATQMYCTNMDTERFFFENLNKVLHFKKKENVVQLLDKLGTVLMVLE